MKAINSSFLHWVLALAFSATSCEAKLGFSEWPVEQSDFGSNFTNSFTSLSPGVLVNDTETPLEKRQYTCDPGYVLCSNMQKCCPAGDECFAEGCCPSGSIPCGAINPSKCYYSSTEKCCAGGSCRKDYDCCERQCCSPVGYCASDGYCSAKPCSVTSTVNAVQTRSTVVTSTRRATVTVFDAEEDQVAPIPEFTCPATTFTESGDSASLELGDNCKLTLHVNEAEESSTPALRRDLTPSTTTAAPELDRRQDMICTATLRGTTTIASTAWTTTNVTITEAPSALPEFSCLAIVVTNSAGDELALGDDCSLEFTPAEESAGAQGDSDDDAESAADGTSTSPESSSLTGPLSASTSGARQSRISFGLAAWCGVLFLIWTLV